MSGFTLIEVLIALFILTIGILGMYSMQLHAIKGNNTAMIITNESNWAADRIEKIIASDYTTFIDTNGNGSEGLDEDTVTTADGYELSSDGNYLIYWNVTEDKPAEPNMKTVKVIVKNKTTSNTTYFSIVKIALY